MLEDLKEPNTKTKLILRPKFQEKFLPIHYFQLLLKENTLITILELKLMPLHMDLNQLLFLKTLLSLINTENNNTQSYGTLFTPQLDMLITVNFPKWITTNSVWESKIVISVLLIFIAVGVRQLKDVCQETKNTLFVPLLVSTDGSLMPNLVMEKSMPVCSPMLPLKPLDSLPLKKLVKKLTLELPLITMLLSRPQFSSEPKLNITKFPELILSQE